jgi:hypothetical protein
MNHAQATNTLLSQYRLTPLYSYYEGIQADLAYSKGSIVLANDYHRDVYNGAKVVRFLLDNKEPLGFEDFWQAVEEFRLRC